MAALAGCKSVPGLYENRMQASVEDKYKPVVNQGDMTLKLPVSSRSRSFSDNQIADLETFLERYKISRAGPLTISRPIGSGNEIVAASASAHIKRMLPRAGISSRTVRMSTYYAGRKRRGAPIVLTYSRYFASTPACGDWSKDLAKTYDNKPYPNFGCAYYHNLAAMVANPRDLQTPRNLGPANAARRDTVLEKYRKGEPTAAQKTNDDSGKVSDVSQ